MKNNKVLVTGGAGYIGSHTVVELLNAGCEVVAVDNLANSEISAIENISKITGKKFPFYKADTCDIASLRKIFEAEDFDSVIHFAAYKAVGESVEEPLKYYQNNLVSFINVIALMREFKRPNIIFSSSATVYGDADEQPVTEQTPLKPANSPYGSTKQICEDILKDSVKAYGGLNGIILRYFNPVGAHPSALIGELPRGVPNNLLPFITQTAAGIRPCLKVFGKDYDTPDGTCVRDFIDVVDLAKAHICALKKLLSFSGDKKCETYNVGTGRGVSVQELIDTFESANGIKLNYVYAERRSGDVPEVWADAGKAKRELGWESQTPLSETLKNAWAWQKNISSIK